MNLRTQPTIITVTTTGEHAEEHQAIRYPTVRRRVKHADGLTISDHTYPQGSIVWLASDRAFTLEQSGHLHPGDPL